MACVYVRVHTHTHIKLLSCVVLKEQNDFISSMMINDYRLRYTSLLIRFNNMHSYKTVQSQLFLWRMEWLLLASRKSTNVVKSN